MAKRPPGARRSSMHSRCKSPSMEISRDGLPSPASSEHGCLSETESTFVPYSSAPAPKIACRIARAEDGSDAEAVVFSFLNEGAANAVFRIQPYRSQQAAGFVFVRHRQIVPRSEVLGRVLRTSKCTPKTLPSEDIVRDFEAEVRPLFRPREASSTTNAHDTVREALEDPDALYPTRSLEHFLMDHELVHLSNDVLEALRRAQYGPDRIPTARFQEQHGILLPDMSLIPGVSVTFEFKPKWLAPSPNAPKGAYRCRTCALHAKRLAETGAESLPYLCPLQLLNGNRDLISDVIMDKFSIDNDPILLEAVTEKAVDYLTAGPGHELLMHLRNLQLQLDPVGVLRVAKYPQDLEQAIHRLRLAMTLRDCSLFLRINYVDPSAPVEAKLVDLDFKSMSKYPDWHDKEVKLINGGWYTNVEAGVDECLLADGWRTWVPRYM